MKKLFILVCLFSFIIQTYAQSEYNNVSKDLAIALKEAKTGFFNIKGKMIDEGEFRVKPNIFISTDNYIEFPSELDSYVFYSQRFQMAANRKEGKKIIQNLIDEAKKVIPQNYELSKGESSDFNYRVTRGYYGVYSPDKGQELLYVLHHPNDKKLNNNKYPSIVFSLNFRNGKSPRINMVVFSASIKTLENLNFIKAEALVKQFNYNCLNDLTIDWEKKQFQFEKNDNEWIDYYAVPFENGFFVDYSNQQNSKIGIKSMTGDNYVVDKGKAIPMDFFWMSYYQRDKQKKGVELFKEIIEVLEIPYVNRKYDEYAIINGYDFTKFLGVYNGYLADVNTNTVDESQELKISIDINFDVIISKKVDDDWFEILNTKLKPDSLKESESGRLYYSFSLEDNNKYNEITITINPDEIAKQLGGAITFSLHSESKKSEYYVANRKWKNPISEEEFSKKIEENLIYNGQTHDDDPWGSYRINYLPVLNLSVINYKNVANKFVIKKKGYIYTIDLFENDKYFDAEFHFIHGKVILEKMDGRIVIGDPTIKAYTTEDALHAIAKLYSEHVSKSTKHATNFTINYEEKKSGTGIVLFKDGHVFVGPYIDYNQANGKDLFYWANGKMENGTFIKSSREGWFDIKEKDITYSGKYQNNTKEGTWIYKNTTHNKSKTVVYKNDEILEESEWE